MARVGAMFSQGQYCRRSGPEKLEYEINRYTKEGKRIYGVIDKRLGEAKYLAGDYSIADIATYPWLVPHSMQGQALEDFPNLKKWYDELRARPATQRGFAVMSDVVEKMRALAAANTANQPPQDPKTWDILFGNKQFEKR